MKAHREGDYLAEEIHRVIEGGAPLRSHGKAGMQLTVEHWRPVENLQLRDKPLRYRFKEGVGLEALLEREVKESDVVLNLGLDQLCALAFESGAGVGGISGKFNWAGIGEDATAAARNQSGLISESMRVPATYAKDAGTGDCSVDAVFSIAVSGRALQECGLVNVSGSAQSGLWYCRDTYTTKNTVSGDTVNLYYTASFSGA